MNSKTYEVLEDIFEFLLSNGRKDLIDAYNASIGRAKEKVCTARRYYYSAGAAS